MCHVASFLSLLTGATGHEQKAKQWHFHVHRPGRSYIAHHSLHQAGGSAKCPQGSRDLSPERVTRLGTEQAPGLA